MNIAFSMQAIPENYPVAVVVIGTAEVARKSIWMTLLPKCIWIDCVHSYKSSQQL
jgi:hypothetical protein